MVTNITLEFYEQQMQVWDITTTLQTVVLTFVSLGTPVVPIYIDLSWFHNDIIIHLQ